MNRVEDRISVWVGVLTGLGGVITALWNTVPLQFFIPSVCALMLLGLYFLLRWAHEQWDTSQIDAKAKMFVSTIHSAHGGLRFALILTILALAVLGVTVKYGPSWIASEAQDHLCQESPVTHIDLGASQIPDQFKAMKKAGKPISDVYFVMVRQQEVRFEAGTKVLEEVAENGLDNVFQLSVVFVVVIFVLLFGLWFFELIGQKTYNIPLQP